MEEGPFLPAIKEEKGEWGEEDGGAKSSLPWGSKARFVKNSMARNKDRNQGN